MEAKCDLKWYLWDRTVDAWNKRVGIAYDNVGVFSSLLTHGIYRTVWRPYSAVSFSTNRYQRHHMMPSWSWEKGCILWVRDVFFIFPSAVLYFVMQCMSSFTFPTRKLCACLVVFICVHHRWLQLWFSNCSECHSINYEIIIDLVYSGSCDTLHKVIVYNGSCMLSHWGISLMHSLVINNTIWIPKSRYVLGVVF